MAKASTYGRPGAGSVGLLLFSVLLSACAAPTRLPIQPTSQPTACEPANLPTCRLAHLQQAAYNYNRYHALAPDDLLGLKRLTEVCTALEDPSTGLRARAGVEDESCREAAERVMEGEGDTETGGQGEGESRNPQFAIRNSPAAVLREALAARTDDRRIVAELLGVPVEDVELGPNLVENGSFVGDNNQPNDPWSFDGPNPGEGLFVGGLDNLGQADSVRIVGLWTKRMSDGRTGYAQYRVNPDSRQVLPEAWYMVSFEYRSQRLEGGEGGLVFWGDYNPGGPMLSYASLEDTGGRWQHSTYVIKQPEINASVMMGGCVRNLSLGSTWYDGLQLRPVSVLLDHTR